MICPFLLGLYNKIFHDGIYPHTWEGHYYPDTQRQKRKQPQNYRENTSSNIIAKINSKLLVLRLSKQTEKHNELIDNQYEFRKRKSTVDCIFLLDAPITKTLARKKKLYTAFPDFEKMFDRIDGLVFMEKVNQYKCQHSLCSSS